MLPDPAKQEEKILLEREYVRLLDNVKSLSTVIQQSEQETGFDHDLNALDSLPACFGNYELTEIIGQGGMGRVYRARQFGAERWVALKIIRPDLVSQWRSNSALVRRFRNESRTLAQLEHGNIVAIYDVGEFKGQPYYSMKLVEGETLSQKIDRGDLPIAKAAEIVQVIAACLHETHEIGIRHRDIKPSNIMVSESGKPYLMDFGLAKNGELDDQTLTRSDAIIGTVAYMAPEQAEDVGNVNVTSEVYSLGAVLYSALTGVPPFKGASTIDLLSKLKWDKPTLPGHINVNIPADLETICCKCIEKSPADRYSNANELADDLKRFLQQEPIAAKRPDALKLSMNWIRNNAVMASMLAGFAAVFVVSFLIVSAVKHRALGNELAVKVKAVLETSTDQLPNAVSQLNEIEGFDESAFASDLNPSQEFRKNLALVQNCPELVGALLETIDRLGPGEIQALAIILSRLEGAGNAASISCLVDWKEAVEQGKGEVLPNVGLAVQLIGTNFRTRNDSQNSGLFQHDVSLVFEKRKLEVTRALVKEPAFQLEKWLHVFGSSAAGLSPTLIQLANGDQANDQQQRIAFLFCQINKAELSKLVNFLEIAKPAMLGTVFQSLKLHESSLASRLSEHEKKMTQVGDKEKQKVQRLNFQLARMCVLDYEDAWVLAANCNSPLHATIANVSDIADLDFEFLATKLFESVGNSRLRDCDIQFLVMMMLGDQALAGFETETQERLKPCLLKLAESADSGVSSASNWLLDKWEIENGLGVPDMTHGQSSGNWYAGPCDLKMIELRNIGAWEFRWQDPVGRIGEPARFQIETYEIEPFAISAREITWAHLGDFRSIPALQASQPDHGEIPVGNITFHQAAQFCNWLTEQAGMTEEQKCYRISHDGKANWVDGFEGKEGYRLPTETEWQVACSGGVDGKRFFGEGKELASRYAWSYFNSNNHPHPVGMLKPNRYGLFDVFGNVSEWTHRISNMPLDGVQVAKGGFYKTQWASFDVAKPTPLTPEWHGDEYGFRVARTLGDD